MQFPKGQQWATRGSRVPPPEGQLVPRGATVGETDRRHAEKVGVVYLVDYGEKGKGRGREK